MLSGCGVPNAFMPHSQQNQPSQATTTGGQTTKPVDVVVPPPPVTRKLLPQKQPVDIVQIGTKGNAALLVNEALATLHYLPLQFSPDEQNVATTFDMKLASRFDYAALAPPTGSWKWTADYPAALTDLWNPSTANVITEGAIMNFERQHGLMVDGVAGPKVDAAICAALRNGSVNTNPYVNVTVSKSQPERLYVWSNGRQIYSTLANTGVAGAPTPNGTYPVYARFQSATMSGTNPDGSKYVDPGVPWINYFYKGDAIHGFPRNSYGYPQSVGCVELPIGNAKTVYGMINYGTLVTITN